MRKLNTHGFTIIELLIATIVSSILILSLLTAFIQITRYFTKGSTQASTQKTTRLAVESIAQKIQTTTGSITYLDPSGALLTDSTGQYRLFCINHSRYSYRATPDITDNIAVPELDAQAQWERALYVEEDVQAGDIGQSAATCRGTGSSAFSVAAVRGSLVGGIPKGGSGKSLLGANMSVVRMDFASADGRGSASRLYHLSLTVLNAPPDAKASDIIDTTGADPFCKGNSIKGTEYCGLSMIDTNIFRLNGVNGVHY